jgi:hypothetical protein
MQGVPNRIAHRFSLNQKSIVPKVGTDDNWRI